MPDSGKGSREQKESLSNCFSETDRNKRIPEQNGAGLSGCTGRRTGGWPSGGNAVSGMRLCSPSKAYADARESSHRRTAEKAENGSRNCGASGI